MPDGTSAPIDNSLPPIPQKEAPTQGDLLMREKFTKEVQENPTLRPEIRKTFLNTTPTPEIKQEQISPVATETMPKSPPTIDELKAGIRPETQKLINNFKKDPSGRI